MVLQQKGAASSHNIQLIESTLTISNTANQKVLFLYGSNNYKYSSIQVGDERENRQKVAAKFNVRREKIIEIVCIPVVAPTKITISYR